MKRAKKAVSLILVFATVLSVVSMFGVSASALSRVTSRYACLAMNWNNTSKLAPVLNNVLYLSGKKTYTVKANYIDPKDAKTHINSTLNTGLTASEQKAVLNKLRFDITVVNPSGSKTYYYNQSVGFKFTLSLRKQYKIYITSYTYDYKTATYNAADTYKYVQTLTYWLEA